MITAKLKYATSHLAAYLQVLLLATPIFLGSMPFVSAAELSTRSVQISTSQPGAAVVQTYRFSIPSTAVIGSITFEYCTNSPIDIIACVPPLGLDLSSAALQSQAGNTGFSISIPDSTPSKLVITRGASAGTIGASSYVFGNIINPTMSGQTTFVRMATHTSTDGSGASSNNGSVAFATANLFQVSAYVPPYLTFCVGVFVTLNCNSVTGSLVDVGELESSLATTANLQFSGATNDGTGFTTFLNGSTMTSGNNVITALSTNSASVPGTSQFGLNLRSNTSPTGGLEPAGAGTSVPMPGYNTPNSFRFVNGEAITSSPLPTDFRLFTATYLVNVSKDQAPGVYATTMTFTAVASF